MEIYKKALPCIIGSAIGIPISGMLIGWPPKGAIAFFGAVVLFTFFKDLNKRLS